MTWTQPRLAFACGLVPTIAAACYRYLRAEPLTDRAQLRFRHRVGRVQFGRYLQLEDRFLVATGGGQPASSEEVLLGCAHPHTLERVPGRLVVGIVAKGIGVFDDRAVVVRALLGLHRETHRSRAGAGARADQEDRESGARKCQACFRGSCHC